MVATGAPGADTLVEPVVGAAGAGPDATDADAPGPLPSGDDVGTPERWVHRIGLAVFGVQFAGLVVLSAFTWRRFTLGVDFAIFNQAWTLIGTGHLDPASSLHGTPFLKNHFELIMWPLALLRPLVRSPFVLLVVQDLALVGTEVLVFVWVTRLLRRSGLSTGWVVGGTLGILVLLLADPGVYSTVVEDFHFEALATFFVVFAALDLWSGRTRRMWVWVVLGLSCGDIAGLYVFGLGLSALTVPRARRHGLALTLVGLAWVVVISVLGANVGSNVSDGYAYLAGRTSLPGGLRGLVLIGAGALTHPSRWVHIGSARFGTAARYVLNGGGIGVVTPWGFAVPLVVLGTSAFQYDGIFIGLPFQNFVVLPFVAFGSAWMVVWLASRARSVTGRRVAAAVGVLAVLCGVVTSAQRLPAALTFNGSAGFVAGPDAAALAQVLARTPHDAEVIAPLPTIGRFGSRRSVYLLVDRTPGSHTVVPVDATTVVVVFDPAIAPVLLPGDTNGALQARLEGQGAQVLVRTPGVTALLWHPPAGTTSLELP